MENCFLQPDEKEALAQVNALFSGILLTSDDPGNYTPEMTERYGQLMQLRDAENVRVEADDGLCIHYTLAGDEQLLQLPR